MANEQYTNNPSTTLSGNSGSITSGATTFNVASSTGFPSGGNFTILIDSELMLVTGVSGTAWTVTRAQEGTSGASHSDGTGINLILTAGSLQRLAIQSHGGTVSGARRQINFVDGGGVTWTLTDDGTNNKTDVSAVVSTGSTWETTYTTPPSTGSLTWVNQGGASVSNNSYGGWFLLAPGGSGDSNRMLVTSVPGGGTWSFVCRISLMGWNTNYQAGGMVIRESSTGKFYRLAWGVGGIFVDHFSDPNTYVTNDLNAVSIQHGTSMPWGKIHYDGTHYTFYISPDGINWMQIAQVGIASYFSSSANQLGVFCNCNTGAFNCGLNVLSWNAA